MKKIIALVVTVFVLLLLIPYLASRPLYDETLADQSADDSVLDSVQIAPLEEALTLARTVAAQESQKVLLVKSYQNGKISAVDLNQWFSQPKGDSIDFFKTYGYEKIKQAGEEGPVVSVNESDLGLPANFAPTHLAAGTNFKSHAEEVGAEDPFVFPKLNSVTPFNSEISIGESRLVDYEVEVALVALESLHRNKEIPQHFGLVLSNDITDRWKLLTGIDLGDEMGYTGFPDGKTREGFLPVGNLLVIPSDLNSFLGKIDIKLFFNGTKRQQTNLAAMVWKPKQLIAEVFKRDQRDFHYQGKLQPLLTNSSVIPERTLILTGTPAGVVFRSYNFWLPFLFIRPGDTLHLSGTFLGRIENQFLP